MQDEVCRAQADRAVEQPDHQVHGHRGEYREEVEDCPASELNGNLDQDDKNALGVDHCAKLP